MHASLPYHLLPCWFVYSSAPIADPVAEGVKPNPDWASKPTSSTHQASMHKHKCESGNPKLLHSTETIVFRFLTLALKVLRSGTILPNRGFGEQNDNKQNGQQHHNTQDIQHNVSTCHGRQQPKIITWRTPATSMIRQARTLCDVRWYSNTPSVHESDS